MHADSRKSTRKLAIVSLGLNSQARAAFEMFFSTRPDASYVFVDKFEDADVGIVDLDGHQARELFADFRKRFTGPTLVLSVRDPGISDATWVSKPVKPTTLLSALATVSISKSDTDAAAGAGQPAVTSLNRVRTVAPADPAATRHSANSGADMTRSDAPQPATQPAAAARQADAGTTGTQPAPAAQAAQPDDVADPRDTTKVAGLALTERRRHPSYGSLTSEMYADPRQRAAFFFDANDYFQGTLQAAMATADSNNRPLRMSANGSEKDLIIYPGGDIVQSDVKEHFLRSLAMVKGSGKQVSFELLPEDTRPGRSGGEPRLQSRSGLLWKVALWTAIGRLPVGTDPEQIVQLSYWPNFTRLFIPLHGIQIASLWAQRPSSLLETADILGVEYRYVFSFYSAAVAIGAVSRANGSPALPATHRQAGQRGILGRLLKYLGASD